MSKNKQLPRLCPFKKILERNYSGKAGKTILKERFAPCAGERCMAYHDESFYGCHCRRLETEEKKK